MSRVKMSAVCLVLIISFGVVGSAGGGVTFDRIYYVAPDGDDNAVNDGGLPSFPLATIQKAIDNAENGDIVKVAEGTYYSVLRIKSDGSFCR